MNEDNVSPGEATISRTIGNVSNAAMPAPRSESAPPRARPRPNSRCTSAAIAIGSRNPGSNAIANAVATPSPTPNRNGRSGLRRRKAPSRRSQTTGSAARATRRPRRPSENAQSTADDRTYADAPATAVPGCAVWRANER
jgi:hypothetical protein